MEELRRTWISMIGEDFEAFIRCKDIASVQRNGISVTVAYRTGNGALATSVVDFENEEAAKKSARNIAIQCSYNS